MLKANSFVADELVNKIKYLHLALDQANSIIQTLEKENSRIKRIIGDLEHSNQSTISDKPILCEI